jgi:hypothetical protein
MTKHIRLTMLWALAGLAALAGSACGSDTAQGTGGGGPPGGQLKWDAGQLANDGSSGTGGGSGSGGFGAGTAIGGAGGSGGSAGSGGSGGSTPTFASNTPNANVTQDAQGDATGLVVTSSNLLDELSAGQYYQQWIALIQNTGSSIACFPRVTAEFMAGSVMVADHYAFADTPPYETGASTLSTSCLGPGEVGGMYSNGFVDDPLSLSNITQANFTIEAEIYPGTKPHSVAPTFSNVQLVETFGPGYWGVTGTLTATGTIYNIGINVFPVLANQLVPERLGDVYLDTLPTSISYAFETTSYQGAKAPGPLHAFADFIEGSALIVTRDPAQYPANDGDLLMKSNAPLTPGEKAAIKQQQRARQRARSRDHQRM